MRNHLSLVLLGLLAATLAEAGGHRDYNAGFQEQRELSLDAGGLNALSIDAGSGALKVRGVAGSDEIRVTAKIGVDEEDEGRARELIERGLRLSLERDGDAATLVAHLDIDGWRGSGGGVSLLVELPAGIALDIRDTSGSIEVSDTEADVAIDDGSGSIEIDNVRAVDVVDGSGSIDVRDAAGDVSIEDGSGSISVARIGGSVRIDDGSGSIRVDGVERDVIIEESGSGSVSIAGVRGSVETDG